MSGRNGLLQLSVTGCSKRDTSLVLLFAVKPYSNLPAA